MRNRRLWAYSNPLLLALLVAVVGATSALAVTSNSDSYKLSEAQFGAGAQNNCSGQYCARASIGSTSGAPAVSTAEFQPVESSDPRLDVIIDPGTSNLGIMRPEATLTKTSVVRVSNYLTGGYTIQVKGDPPKFGNHTLATPTNPTASTPGTEQFAINIAQNSLPSVGAAPLQVPSGVATFGEVTDDYKTPNVFKYVSEDVVAGSDAESGRTDFTISFIVNVSPVTPAGKYTGEYEIIVMPAF